MEENKVDLSPYNLLIATPMATGRPEDVYCTAVENTRQLIRMHGGKVENFKTKYVSDIYYARSKLFGAFLRAKQFTHMIMVDDDMGFTPEDVVWMLLLQRDMIAAVGPKKVYPIEYAFNMIGDDGKPALLYHETETNVAEVPFVGAAFMMISRACAEKMATAYPELEYEVENGVTEHSIFDSVIINRRRLSEDYAFCWRWRKLGGKVYVKMDCTITHTGSHTFTGNLYEYLLKTQPSFSQDVKVAASA